MNSNGNQKDVSITTVEEFPFDLNTFLIVSKFISCSIGIPLNLSVVVAITGSRQLRNQPRNIFLLAITFSYLIFFVPAIVELIHWESVPIKSVCQANVAVIGLTHALLLLNMSLALMDRYVAINHPVWYREKMTASLACAIVTFGSALIALLIKFVYVLKPSSTLCQMWNVHTITLMTVLFLLISICTVLNWIVYRQTLKIQEHIAAAAAAEVENIEWVELDDFANKSRGSVALDDLSSNIRSMPIHYVPDIINSLDHHHLMSETEIKATRTLIVGVTSFVVTAYVSVGFVSSFFACRITMGELQCGNLTWIPAFYGSLIFLIGNDELRKTWARASK
jgi:hypothetical protein